MEYPQIDSTLLKKYISTSHWRLSEVWLLEAAILDLPGLYITPAASIVDIYNIWEYMYSRWKGLQPINPIGELALGYRLG